MSKLRNVLLLVVACGAFLIAGMLINNSNNVLQSSVWNVNNNKSKWEFSNGTIYVESTNKTYNYKLKKESNLKIKDGTYAGNYRLQSDDKGYHLIPLDKQGQGIKLTKVTH